MKEIELSSKTFNMVMKMSNNFRANDDSRPVLKKICLKAEKNKIIFVAINGFIASKISNYTNEELEPFECVFYPFKVDEDKRGLNTIKIRYSDDFITFVYKDNELNEITKKVKNLHEEFINYDRVVNHDIERTKIAIDNNLLLRALNAFKNSNNKVITLEFTNNPTQPILIENSLLELGQAECIVLPIRTLRWNYEKFKGLF